MTFQHLHYNVVPVLEPDARPREVLTWKDGVYEGSPEEWASLRREVLSAWRTAVSDRDR